jgi:hypothetical protein
MLVYLLVDLLVTWKVERLVELWAMAKVPKLVMLRVSKMGSLRVLLKALMKALALDELMAPKMAPW